MQPQEQQEQREPSMHGLKRPVNKKRGISFVKGIRAPEDLIDTVLSSLKNTVTNPATSCYCPTVGVLNDKVTFDLCDGGIARKESLPVLKSTGDNLFQEEDYVVALAYYTKQLRVQRSIFPAKLVDIAVTMNSIGLTLHRAEKFNKAGEIFQSALQIRLALISQEEEASLQNQQAKRRRHDRSTTFECSKGGKNESESLCADHPIFPTILYNMGQLLSEMGRPSEALKSYRLAKCLSNKLVRIVREEHILSIATVLHDVGFALYTKFGFLGEASQILSEALGLFDAESAKEHPAYSQCLTSLGRVFYDDDNYDDAIDCFEESLRIQREMWGKDSPRTTSTLYNIGHLLDLVDRKEEALKKFHEALQIIRSSSQASSSRLSSDETTSSSSQSSSGVTMPVVLKAIGTIYHDMGNSAQAMMAFTEAMATAGIDQEEGLLSLVDGDQRTALALHETMANAEALWSEKNPPASAAA